MLDPFYQPGFLGIFLHHIHSEQILFFFQQSGLLEVFFYFAVAGFIVGMFGDGDTHAIGIGEHLFQLGDALLAVRIPVIPIGAVEDLDIVISSQVFFFNDLIDQTIGRGHLGTAGHS